MRGFRIGGMLDRLSLPFAIDHDRRDRLVGRCARLAWLAATTTTPAPPAPPFAATATRLLASGLAMRLAVLAASLHSFLFVLALVVAFFLVDGFLDSLLVLHDRGNGRGLDRNRARLLDAVDLVALLDQVGQLPRDARVGIDHDGDLEALLQHAQMRPLLIEQVERDLGACAYDEVMGRALEQRLFE